MQLTLDKLEEREGVPGWNNLSGAAKSRRIDEDKTQSSQKLHNIMSTNLISTL